MLGIRESNLKTKPRIMVVASLSLSLIKFRFHMIKLFRDMGFEVVTAAPDENEKILSQLSAEEIDFFSTRFHRTGLNPFRDLPGIFDLYRLILINRPRLVFPYTVKPVLYTCFLAFLFPNLKVVTLISGLGIYFTEGSRASPFVKFFVHVLYKMALFRANVVVFQNPDDRILFVSKKLVASSKTRVVSGSGVCLDEFAYKIMPKGPIRVLLIARLLRTKGVVEFLEAARICGSIRGDLEFVLAGASDSSPDGIPIAQLETLLQCSKTQYLGSIPDVRDELERASIVVLPSYREGVPRSILEAMAVGRPVIVSDVPGCRETVQNGKNGILIPARDAKSLAEAIIRLSSSPDRMEEMGKQGRRLCEDRFDVNVVNRDLVQIVLSQIH
jgi:glycosyltransferase involved in cell wall biosynthesis